MAHFTFEALSASELDLLVVERLANKKIAFFKPLTGLTDLNHIKEHFKNEFLSFNFKTASEFINICYRPLKNILTKAGSSIPQEYHVFILRFGGYADAVTLLLKMGKDEINKKLKEPPLRLRELQEVFTWEELEQMTSTLQKLVLQFKDQLIDFEQDFLRGRTKETAELDKLTRFAESVVELPRKESLRKDLAVQLDLPYVAKLALKQESEKIFGSKAEQLQLLLSKLLLYWEVVHQSGYIIISDTLTRCV